MSRRGEGCAGCWRRWSQKGMRNVSVVPCNWQTRFSTCSQPCTTYTCIYSFEREKRRKRRSRPRRNSKLFPPCIMNRWWIYYECLHAFAQLIETNCRGSPSDRISPHADAAQYVRIRHYDSCAVCRKKKTKKKESPSVLGFVKPEKKEEEKEEIPPSERGEQLIGTSPSCCPSGTIPSVARTVIGTLIGDGGMVVVVLVVGGVVR